MPVGSSFVSWGSRRIYSPSKARNISYPASSPLFEGIMPSGLTFANHSFTIRFSLVFYIYIIKQTGAVYHTAPVILLYVLIVFIIDRLRAYTI